MKKKLPEVSELEAAKDFLMVRSNKIDNSFDL